jgi:PAS domain S-box-containing protein
VRELVGTLARAADSDRFLGVLQEALGAAAVDRIPLDRWQELLTALEGSLLEGAGSTRETLRLSSLFQQAAVLLSESLRGEQGMRAIELQGHLTQLRRAMERLISGESIEELMNDIAEELDRLDIRTCFIVCYPEERPHHRGEPWAIPETARIMLARRDGHRIILGPQEDTFAPAEGFIPARLLPDGRPFVLVATTAFFREDQLGYMAFEPGRRDYAIYETFSVQLSSLLKGSRMFDELRREKALLSILMDTVPDHIYFKDAASRFLLINRSLAAALGLESPHDAAGRTDFDYFAEEHARAAREAEERIMTSGAPLLDEEEKETWADGRVTWVETTKMPLRDSAGAIVGTFGLSKDITERRRSEEKILRLAALVESSQEAIFGVDTASRITTWNSGAAAAFGYSAEEIVGTSVFILLEEELPERECAAWERAAAGTPVPPFEAAGKRKDGSVLPLTIALAPIREPRGAVVGLAVTARDMTRENAIQARLIQAQRLESLGTLAAGVAHQFNNINMVIRGYLDALATADGLPPSAAAFAAEALRGVDRLVDITDRMQGLTGAPHNGQDNCRLNEVARAQLPGFEARVAAMGASLTLELRETPPVHMYAARAGFLFSSLLGNALDALTGIAVRKLTIRTGLDAAGAFLDVTDTGCGIHRADLPKLFTPFYSTKGEWAGPNSPQAALRGIGLSLSICRSIVSESGGRIEVDSEPGAGSTFHVWLPAGEELPEHDETGLFEGLS